MAEIIDKSILVRGITNVNIGPRSSSDPVDLVRVGSDCAGGFPARAWLIPEEGGERASHMIAEGITNGAWSLFFVMETPTKDLDLEVHFLA